MIDIDFYMKSFDLARLFSNESSTFEVLESIRSDVPFVYNIETTNACNMKCVMCPRTTSMTRPVQTMDMKTFVNIIEQINPHSDEKWSEWEKFAAEKYNISKDEMSENHFFLYIIPKVIVLHGYGEPLLDPHLIERVRLLTKRKIPSYFSCNPSNIDVNKTVEMFKSGLGYIKYSIESVDDSLQQKIRGRKTKFSETRHKIMELLKAKKDLNLKTTIVITMLNLGNDNQINEFNKLKNEFSGEDVYIYMKSQDQLWYQDKKQETNAIHWKEFCKFPWSSMGISSNGCVVGCPEDLNNELMKIDTRNRSLHSIWNGEEYTKFRLSHCNKKPRKKCSEQCDMKLISDIVPNNRG